MSTFRIQSVAIAFVVMLSVGGCAATTRRGVVVMKIDDAEAHVGLGAGEVEVGDRLTLFRYFCRPKKCSKRAIGTGEITEVLNDSYSVARFNAQINLREGDIVERSPSEQ